MKPVLSGFFDQGNRTTIEEQIVRAKMHHMDCIALRMLNGKELIYANKTEIKEAINVVKNDKIRVSVIDPMIPSFHFEDEEGRKEAASKFKQAAMIADKFKATGIFFKLPIFNDIVEDHKKVIEALSVFTATATHYHKQLIILPSGNLKANSYAYLIKKLRHANVSIAFDPTYFITNGESTTTAYRLLKEHVLVFRAVDCDFNGIPKLLGYGKSDALNMFKKLIRDNYSNYIFVDNDFEDVVSVDQPEYVPKSIFGKAKDLLSNIFIKKTKDKTQNLSELSRKLYPDEKEIKNVTYDDVLENQIKFIKNIFE